MAVGTSACGATATPSPIESWAPVASPTPNPTPRASPSAPGTVTAPTPTPIPAFDPAGIRIRLVKVVDGLQSPIGIADPGDDSGRLFVIEQAGRIRIIRNGTLVDRPFLDIRDRILTGAERGLLGLAFHPYFPSDPRLFVNYTNLHGNTVVASFTVRADDPDRANRGSERVVLRVDQPFANHNGGGLAFGPDGDMYIGLGDGGSAGDPYRNGQRLDTLLGKMLRIQVGAPDGSGPAYFIPPDAPFATNEKARPEIRAYGFRNPWRFSFDRLTGDLWIGDVGQNRWEEIDELPASVPPDEAPNFGWNLMEGRHCYVRTPCDRTGLRLPVAEYAHDEGCAIIGGYVGRDPAEPLLYGGYLFSDNCSGRIWAVSASGPRRQDPTLVLNTDRRIASFGEDAAGRLYVADMGSGELLRIIASPR